MWKVTLFCNIILLALLWFLSYAIITPVYNHLVQYSNPEYSEIVKELKKQLLETREEIGDTDEKFPRIKEIFEINLDDQ